MEIITSVKAIGPITALNILIYTNEFRNINNPKKFACYAGVAPFKDESGKSKSKGRVSHFANKKMKALLHLCAATAKKSIPEIRDYFERKTINEGKSKMSVLNAIRYKLILRVFACVNQDRCYENNYVRPV
ncbi:IS110 family transposase [Mucilaginibacter sp. HMF5004]|uniref:transposase n=1 Tax=Mucilaginibacter rivuli TaxID=2857527 RepID=UPI001C5D991C|nr:transposase [Mucilaginibacter rivuli]MBW4890143.1 IS110 family transposase [Mucilaginibacter rivuli]